jgi:hypothetical protein
MADTPISVAQGSLSLSGKVPVFEVAANVSVSSLVLTTHTPQRGVGLFLRGYAPESLTFEIFALPSADALNFTGYAPFPFRELFGVPAIDTLTLTGQAPTILQDSLRTPAEDDLTLAGKVPTVDTPDARVGDPGRRALAFFTEAPVVVFGTNTVIGPAIGAIAFAGQAPTASTSINLWEDPLVGSLSLTGYAPSFITGLFVSVPVDNLFLTGRSVETSPSTLVNPLVGGLTLTTKANYVAAPPLTLSLAGQAVTISLNEEVPVGAAALTLALKTPLVETVGFKATPAYLARLDGRPGNELPTVVISSFLTPGKGDIISLTTVREVIHLGSATDELVT